jgi:branched-chain amino acid transport system permease protein
LSLALALLLLIVPLLVTNNFVLHALTMSLVFAILAASWDFLFGFAGQVSFGHAGFFGLGAYVSALLSYYFGLSPWITIFLGGAAASIFGFAVGFPSLRLRGVYLALATLACAEMLRIVVTNWVSVTHGTLGFNLHPGFPYIPRTPVGNYYVILAGAALSTGIMYALATRSRIGLVLRALAADDIRAQALGIDVFRMKLLAFSVSGFFAGFAGALYAHFIQLVTPTEAASSVTILIIAMATIGGVGTIIGPAIAAIVIHFITEMLQIAGTVFDQIAVGVILMLFVLFLPEGIAGLARKLSRNGRKSRQPVSRLLVRPANAERQGIGVSSADNLQASGQAIGRKPIRNGQGTKVK